MKKGMSLVLAGLLACGLANGANRIDAAHKAYIVARLCTEVKYNFAFYHDLKLDWDSLCNARLPELVATHSDEEFVKGLERLCAQLRDGHTSVYQANDPENPEDWIRPMPMKTRRIGNRVFVTDVFNSDFIKQGVCRGCEVLTIDGMGVLEYGEREIVPYLASSTAQWSRFAPFSEYELTKARGSKVSALTLRTPEGRVVTISSNRNMEWDVQEKKGSNFEFRTLEGNIGCLVVKSFANGRFRAEDFDSLYGKILETDALIIDIRGNTGGNSNNADFLVRHFAKGPVKLGRWCSPMYVAAFASWNYPPKWYMESPHPLSPIKGKSVYEKPLALLVDAMTFSSAENFCVAFKSLGHGVVIGSPTGGSTGNPIRINLGYGIYCNICTKKEWDAEGKEFIGVGIMPDIMVEESEDLFLQGRDNVVEKAVDVLRKRMDADKGE